MPSYLAIFSSSGMCRVSGRCRVLSFNKQERISYAHCSGGDFVGSGVASVLCAKKFHHQGGWSKLVSRSIVIRLGNVYCQIWTRVFLLDFRSLHQISPISCLCIIFLRSLCFVLLKQLHQVHMAGVDSFDRLSVLESSTNLAKNNTTWSRIYSTVSLRMARKEVSYIYVDFSYCQHAVMHLWQKNTLSHNECTCYFFLYC